MAKIERVINAKITIIEEADEESLESKETVALRIKKQLDADHVIVKKIKNFIGK